MTTICGSNCCEQCSRLEECGGCAKVNGKPFGGECIAANCIKSYGKEAFEEMKNSLIAEINALEICSGKEGIQKLKVEELFLLNGFFVNLEYPLSNGATVKFLKDNNIYLGCQVEQSAGERCYGVVADETMILVCEYGCMGADPVLLCYKRR